MSIVDYPQQLHVMKTFFRRPAQPERAIAVLGVGKMYDT